MCIIMVGKVRSVESLDLECGWASNPHGAGVCYVDRGSVVAVKGIMNLHDLERELSKIKGNPKIALHLRYATHGKISESNTHPFQVGRSGSWLMHNGMLSAFGRSGDRGVSDSRDLADTLGRMKEPSDRVKILRSLSGMYALISRKGIELYGSRSWVEINGVACSNTSCAPFVDTRSSRLGSGLWEDQYSYQLSD